MHFRPEIPWDTIIDSFQTTLTEQQRNELEAWLSEECNKAAYMELRSLYIAVQEKSSSYHPNQEYYLKQLTSQLQLGEKGKRKRTMIPTKKWRYTAAAAILLAVLLTGTFYAGRHTLQSANHQQTVTTYGGKTRILLPDGTEVWLRGASTITYPSAFQKKERIVKLSGEAYFEVAKDKSKPFIVNALDRISICALGTRFNVIAAPSENNIVVSLLEGKVKLPHGSKSYLMKPGDEATYCKQTDSWLLRSNADVSNKILWRKSQLRFENEPLGSIAAKLESWYGTTIEVDNELKNMHRYTFTLRSEPLEEVLRIMNRINPMSYSFTDSNKVTITMKR